MTVSNKSLTTKPISQHHQETKLLTHCLSCGITTNAWHNYSFLLQNPQVLATCSQHKFTHFVVEIRRRIHLELTIATSTSTTTTTTSTATATTTSTATTTMTTATSTLRITNICATEKRKTLTKTESISRNHHNATQWESKNKQHLTIQENKTFQYMSPNTTVVFLIRMHRHTWFLSLLSQVLVRAIEKIRCSDGGKSNIIQLNCCIFRLKSTARAFCQRRASILPPFAARKFGDGWLATRPPYRRSHGIL